MSARDEYTIGYKPRKNKAWHIRRGKIVLQTIANAERKPGDIFKLPLSGSQYKILDTGAWVRLS